MSDKTYPTAAEAREAVLEAIEEYVAACAAVPGIPNVTHSDAHVRDRGCSPIASREVPHGTMRAIMEISDDLLAEQAQLVARGVRPLALVGHVDSDADTVLRVRSRLDQTACDGAIPFVIRRDDGIADYGYAATAWAIDLLEWLTDNDAVPPVQQHRIVGLLLGYNATAVREYEERGRGRPARLTGAV